MSVVCRSLSAVASPNARVLVLGSLPGAESLARGQYYANSTNSFWTIIGEILQENLSLLPYPKRLQRLKNRGVALWDVCRCAERTGSLDTRIKLPTVVPNDFVSFLRTHPRLALIAFNGQTAHTIFARRVMSYLSSSVGAIPCVTLPSTSPAHAALSRSAKLEVWKSALMPHLASH